VVEEPPRYSATDLFLKLSVWVVPTFVIGAILGLQLLSRHVVSEVETALSARVGSLSGRVASALERIGDRFVDTPELAELASQEVLLTLMSDSAVQCAELIPVGSDKPILMAPMGLGCHAGVEGTTTVLPIWFDGEADLLVTWEAAEVTAARTQQRELSLIILLFGLSVALVTNWLAFRVIIGRPLQALVSRIDEARQKAEHNALHDGLTGLANRRALDDRLENPGPWTDGRSGPITCLSLDLDGFKQINDTLGHPAGDHVLRVIAGRLAELVDESDFLARIGGDEFVVLLGPGRGLQAAEDLARRIITAVGAPIDHDGECCQIGASVGIAASETRVLRGKAAERVLMNADIALYEAKRRGRRRHVRFTSDMRTEMEERRQLADELPAAIRNGEIHPVYQPQMDPSGQRIVGLEALVRWSHPRRGLLPPGRFLSIADEAGLTGDLDSAVLRRALTDLEAWSAEGLSDFTLSVNCSALRLADPELIPEIRSLDLPPGRIVFEVLGTICRDTEDPIVRFNLDGLKELGIDLEIDDFGTGRASISSVLALGPRRIKVAREIVNAFAEDGAQTSLLRALEALGRALGVGLIAEGVETARHLDRLRGLHFERLQGYAFGRPDGPAETLRRLRAQAARAPGDAAKTG